MMRIQFRFMGLAAVTLFVLATVLVVNNAVAGHVARGLARAAYYTGRTYQCNICGTSLRMFEQGEHTRGELQCPYCRSRPRHRTAYIFFTERSDLFSGTPKRMLHVAPEASLGPKFRAVPGMDYLSGDIEPGLAMVVMDITNIQYPDNSFDVIYCSHVLEHVQDDRKGLAELARVLKPGGWAVIAVPILREDHTLDDPTITSSEDRMRFFGQEDHVRAYGPDFADRLREAGFTVTVDDFASRLPAEVVRRHGLSRENIYVARKAAALPG